ncbi:hypothetical protein DV738_g4119, partial [Chaetothyriales sp. CBS 135597]
MISALSRRAVAADAVTPLASVFALVIRQPSDIYTTTPIQRRSVSELLVTPHFDYHHHHQSLSPLLLGDSTTTTSSSISRPAGADNLLAKRQVYVLAIPTTYYGLNSGPSPGVVVGIMLGSIAGFLLVGWVFLLLVRVYSGRAVRRERRRTETIVSEERIRPVSVPPPEPSHFSEDNEIIVEEEPEDIIEVIEEHSPERRDSRRESRSKRSGFRTVDPAEFGGGDAPRRSISRR